MGYALVPVTNEERDTLWRLLQYSLYEESATDGNAPDARGIYEYQYFDEYFADDPCREAYLIRNEQTNQLLGFAMIHAHVKEVPNGWSIAEFMILPNARRNHIGEHAACELFERHPGPWEVRPSTGSEAALCFWQKTVSDFASDFEFRDGYFVFDTSKEENKAPVNLDNIEAIQDYLVEQNSFHDYWINILDYNSETAEIHITIEDRSNGGSASNHNHTWTFIATSVTKFRSVSAAIMHGFPIDQFYFEDGQAIIEGNNGGIIIRADNYKLCMPN